MEPNDEKLKALEEAFEVLCKTGDPTQWIEPKLRSGKSTCTEF